MPSPTDFVFARWAELTDDDPPWWTRPPGVGLRLLLEELGELAAARSTGTIAKEAVSSLIDEAQRFLFADDSLCRRRYQAVSENIRKSISDRAPENWLPEAAGPSAIGAALKAIDDDSFLPTLVGLIDEDASKFAEITDPFKMAQAMTALEVNVELLDAELVYDGHSLRWRKQVCADAKKRADDGATLGDAILSALGAHRHNDIRDFDCFVVVGTYSEPNAGRLGLEALKPEEAIANIIRPWNADGLEAVLARHELRDASRLIRYQLPAADVDAAARAVNREFERDVDLWRLRGGTVSGSSGSIVIIYDSRCAAVHALPLPAEPLDVLPRRLGTYTPARGEDASRLDDALLQLAQARSAPPGTAIVNVWTGAEALFGGVVGETRANTAAVVAGLAELLYLLDLFRWLGDRYTNAGFEGAPPGGSSRWGFDQTLENTSDVLDTLARKGDALAWWRLKVVAGWKGAPRLREQLSAFGKRMEQVGARAYLVRNSVVHSARIRRALLDVTLPPFTGLVRECIGYVAHHGDSSQSLKTAKGAAIAVRHVANRVADKKVTAAVGVESLLPAEPGKLPANEEALGSNGRDSDDADTPAPSPGAAVPVEDIDQELTTVVRESDLDPGGETYSDGEVGGGKSGRQAIDPSA